MATFVHIVATAIIVSIVAVVLYWFIRRYERQQGKAARCPLSFAAIFHRPREAYL
jgi:heme/copper-type cytochrome/quinol oxidase subunit 2